MKSRRSYILWLVVAWSTLGGCDEKGNVTALERLLETYQQSPPANVLAQLKLLTPADFTMLGTFQRVGTDVYGRACNADPTIRFVLSGSIYTCQRLLAEMQNSYRLGMTLAGWRQSVEGERLKILNARRCSRGAVDKGTCGAYFGTMRRVNKMRQNTSTRIIDNIGGKCRVGIDPGCRYR